MYLNSLFFGFTLFLSTVITVNAQREFIFEQGLRGYTGTRDVQVNNLDHLEINYGGQPSMIFGYRSDTNINMALLHFDDIIGNGEGQIPPDSTVLSAQLDLAISYERGDLDSLGFNLNTFADLHEMLVRFDDNASYENQPFGNAFLPEPGIEYDGENAIEIFPDGPSVINLDVTGSVTRWVDGSMDNNGWIIIPAPGARESIIRTSEAGTGDAAFHSPILIVDTPSGQYTFQDRVDGYNGLVDTWIEEIDPNQAPGRFAGVSIDGGASEASHGLVRFDNIIGTEPGQIPPGTQINSAKINIFVYNPGDHVNWYDLKTGNMVFNEFLDFEAQAMGLTPNTLNTFGDPEQNPSKYFDADNVVYQMPERTLGEHDVDVTSSIQRYANGEENTGWILIHEGGFGGADDGVEFCSSDYGPIGGPVLQVTTSDGTYSFIQGRNGYQGVTDVSISVGAPNDALSRYFTMRTGEDDFILIKFEDLFGSESYQIPPTASVQSASLKMSIMEYGSYNASYHELLPGYEFDDNTTWNNFTGDLKAANAAGTVYAAESLGDYYSPRDFLFGQNSPFFFGDFTIDVTSSIQKYQNGEPNTGWVVVQQTGIARAQYPSSETSTVSPPRLTVVIEGPAAVSDYMLY